MSKTYSAGIVTAYGAAKRAGYQGTYEDFCRQQAGYAGNAAAVEAAKTAAQTAANTATTKAGEATTAATAAQTAKAQTEQSASLALMDISTARSGAISAVHTEGAKQTANARAQAQAAAQSATTASTKASEASASATTATTKATEAAASATNAANAASAAQGVLESIPEDYSDLSEDVDQLKADLKSTVDYSPAITWAMGAISSTQGTETDSSTRIHTGYTDCRVVEVQTGYKYIISAYNDATYIGMWNGTTFEKTASWRTTKSVLPTNSGYIYRLVLAKSNDSSIETADGANLICYAYTDTTFTIPGASADAKAAGDAINKLSADLNEVKYDVIIEKSTSGYAYADYQFKAGEIYEFRNLYSGATVANAVNEKSAQATTITNITGGATGDSIYCVIPLVDTSVIRVYFQSANGKAGIRKIGTLSFNLDSIESNYGLLTRKRTFSIQNGASYVYYPMKAGKLYRVRNITEQSGSNYAVQLYTRTTPTGPNVKTITSSLLPNNAIVFTAENDTDFISIHKADALHKSIVSIDEVGTITDTFSTQTNKKPYQSGQINFTVPVNQLRLYNTQGTDATAQDNTTNIVDVECVCMLPTTYNPTGKPSKLLMICHGSGGGVSEGVWFRNETVVLDFFQKFIDAGYVIFDCNGYANGSSGQEHWGVEKAVWAYHKAYEYMIKNYNVEKQLNIYAFSMGGLAGLNYLNAFPQNVKALALGSPVVSIYSTVWVDYSVQAKGDIATAYGFANSTNYEVDTVANCDPFARMKQIDNVNYYPVDKPVKIWHGDSDTAVYYTYSQQLATAMKNSGAFAYYRLVTGKGHEICYGGNAVVNQEILDFLERFN